MSQSRHPLRPRPHRPAPRVGRPRRSPPRRSPAVTLLAPLALAALLVPLAIYLVHWLFGTRQRLRVPAIFLWADLPQASAGRSKRRWPPITLLLLLQLLAATLAAFALARPAPPNEPPRHLALILDASARTPAPDPPPLPLGAARPRPPARVH